MKYQVQIKYTNPAHEHVSLRRRVETVTRLVEAANEQEAINRAANQQRALGFLIKEAEVYAPVNGLHSLALNNNEPQKGKEKKKELVGKDGEKTDVGAAGGMKEGFDTDPKDIAAYLVDRHGKGKVTMDHIEAYERRRDSYRPIEKHEVMKHVKKMSEEVVTEEESIEEAKQVDHAKTIAKSLAATHPNFRVSSYDGDYGRAHVVHHKSDTKNFRNGEELMGPNIQLQHNHKTNKVHMEMQGDFDRVPDRDEETHHPDKAHEAAHKMFKPAIDLIHKTDKKTTNEEVEQIDEEPVTAALLGVASGALGGIAGVRGVNYALSKHPRNKPLTMIPDRKFVGNAIKGAILPHKWLNRNKKPVRTEELEQVDEDNALQEMKKEPFTITDHLDNRITRYPNGSIDSVNPAGVSISLANHAFFSRKGTEKNRNHVEGLMRKATDAYHAAKLMNTSGLGHTTWRKDIDDFNEEVEQVSEEMPAYVKKGQEKFDAQTRAQRASERANKAQAGTLVAQKARKAAERMVNRAKGNANKIDVAPTIEPGKPNLQR